jgi:hypothetical protein
MSCDPLISFTKDPAARLDYVVNWSAWLGAGIIESSSWSIKPVTSPPLAVSEDPLDPTFTDTSTRVFLEGGKVGTSYTITNQIAVDDGRIDERSFTVVVANR